MISTASIRSTRSCNKAIFFHENATPIPSTNPLYEEEWFGRSLEKRDQTTPESYCHGDTNTNRAPPAAYTSSKAPYTKRCNRPRSSGNSIASPFLKLLLKSKSFLYDPAWSWDNALVILHLCASLPFSVSAGEYKKEYWNAIWRVVVLCFFFHSFFFWREIENSRNLLSEPVFIRFLAQVFGESSNFFFLN